MTPSSLAERQPNMPVPADCTADYARGWGYGDWWVAQGGNLRADAAATWSDEKANGFYDRLTAERDAAARTA